MLAIGAGRPEKISKAIGNIDIRIATPINTKTYLKLGRKTTSANTTK